MQAPVNTAADSFLRIENLSFAYRQMPVLSIEHVELPSGSLCGLFGPNGCGKTTLFKCCLNLLKINKGEIFLKNLAIRNASPSAVSKIAAYVPQEHKPPFPYRVFELVLMGRTPHLRGGLEAISAEDNQKTHEALERVGIASLSCRNYDELSGGQRQLVMIARALAQDTPILFLDEPTSALDFHHQVEILLTLKKLAAEGKSIILCSHDPNHILWYCDQVVMMGQGKIYAQGTPADCFSDTNMSEIYQDYCKKVTAENVEMIIPSWLKDTRLADTMNKDGKNEK